MAYFPPTTRADIIAEALLLLTETQLSEAHISN